MEKQNSGVILTTSSMVSIYGQPSGFAYPASKFAVNGMTLSLARELGPHGIRVNAVAPGITETDMMKAVPAAVIEPMIQRIPLRRLGQPEDIANAFLFLASEEASYITGVILSVDGWFAVNYAMRHAVEDLTQFPDFEEVVKPFYQSALDPLTYDDGTRKGIYALPETQLFSVLFYREDVLEELGLEVPQTWEDLIAILPTIQGNNMSVGVPFPDISNVDMSGFNAMIYQNGGGIYNEKKTKTTIDSEAGVAAFKLYTSLYNDYGLPVVYDFVSRFRSGEMPVAVAQYSQYNTLAVSAPEIRGLWDFTLYPGTLQEDGSIDRSVHANGACCIMVATDDETVKKNAWEFMKWWTSADAQVRFGREMESVLGASARYATANRQALKQLAWSADQLKVLEEMQAWGVGFPEIAGGYSTTRHMTNAIRKVINEKADPRETLLTYTRTINEEIEIKRQEFGLPIDGKED
jgi:ABC-type glycerol-3-phosphate transport system substrate-binding protein